MHDRGTIYFIVVDLVNGSKEFTTREEAIAYYQRPLMDSPERVVIKAEVLKKKVRILQESEL